MYVDILTRLESEPDCAAVPEIVTKARCWQFVILFSRSKFLFLLRSPIRQDIVNRSNGAFQPPKLINQKTN